MAKEPVNKDLFKAMVGNLNTIAENQADQTQQLINIEEAVKESSGSGEGGAEQIFEENIADKAAANEQAKQTGFLAGLFKKSEEKKDEGGFFGFIKKHWGKLLIALALLLTPLKDLGKAFLSIKDYFANNSWGDIGTDIGLGLLAVLGLKVAGGLLFTKISSMILSALMPAGAALPGGVPAAGAMGTAFVKAIPIMGLVVGIGLAIKDALTAVDLKDEWKVDGMSAAIGGFLGGTSEGWKGAFRTGGRWAITGASAGFLMGGPVGAAIGGIGGLVIGGLLGFIGGKKIAQWINAAGKTIKKVFDKLPEIIKSVTDKLAEWGSIASDGLINIIRKLPGMGDFSETSEERKQREMKEGVGGDIRDAEGKLTETGQKKFDEAKTKEGFGKATGGAATAISKGDKEGMRAELNAIFDTVGAKKATGEQKSNIRALQKALAMEDAPAAVTPEPPAKPAARKMSYKSVKTDILKDEFKSTTAEKSEAEAESEESKGGEQMPPSWDRRSKAKVDTLLDGGMKTKVSSLVSGMWTKHGVDLGVTSATRGAAEQEALKKKGASKAGFGSSLHNYGAAVDVHFNNTPGGIYDGPWNILSAMGKGLGMRWGGDWKSFKDKPHFQIDKTWQEASKSGMALAAAKGFSGTVNKATGFIAGEEGPERVNIVPLDDPSVKMDGINKLHDDRMASQGGTPSINVVTSNQTNNSSDQSAVLIPGTVRPGKPIEV